MDEFFVHFILVLGIFHLPFPFEDLIFLGGENITYNYCFWFQYRIHFLVNKQ